MKTAKLINGKVEIINGTISATNVEDLLRIDWTSTVLTLWENLTVNNGNSIIWWKNWWKIIIDWAILSTTNSNNVSYFVEWARTQLVMNSGKLEHKGTNKVSLSVSNWATATIEWWEIYNDTATTIVSKWDNSKITISNWKVRTNSTYVAGYSVNWGEIVVNWWSVESSAWVTLTAIYFWTQKWWTVTINWGTINKAVGAYEWATSKVVINWWTIWGESTSWWVYVNNWASASVWWGNIKWYVWISSAWGSITITGWKFTDDAYAKYYIADWYIDSALEWGDYKYEVVEAVTVTLVNWETSTLVQIEKWSEYAVPSDPETVEWKVFMWWYNWDTKYVATEISEATTLTAKWWYNVTLTWIDWATLHEWITSPVVVEENTAFDSTITPTKDWYLFDWWYTDEQLTTAYNNNVINTATSLYAKWSTVYTVTISQANGWTISSDKTTAKEWDTVTLTATPNSNYNFTSWSVKDADDNEITVTNNSFTMPAGNVTVSATFTKKSSWGGGSSSSNSSNTTTNDWDDTPDDTADDPTQGDTTTINPELTDVESQEWYDNWWDQKEVLDNGLTRELNNAYEFAFRAGITTMKSAENANMEWTLNRIAMAKMLSQYAINVLGKKPDTSRTPNFWDVTDNLDKDYDNGVTLAYQLGIMGIWIDEFRPYDEVPRAEFVTALSRLLYGLADWTDNYYSTHMAKLQKEWIITNTDPNLQELRGYVMLMLMRSAK